MLKIVLQGVMLLGMLSCVSLDRTMMYAVDLEYQEATVATKDLNIKHDPKVVAEWNYTPDILSINEIPQLLMCFSLETWLTVIKPNIKKASRKYRDQQNKKASK